MQDVTRASLDVRGENRGGRQMKDGGRLPNANVRLEPVSPGGYNLSYACLLIPRASDHYLGNKVEDFLRKTIQEICKVFGWRLDFIQVQPGYVQWVVSAPPSTPPSKCIHTIREQTSAGILGKFREFRDKKSKSPQDFWAPGYLVLVGSSPHPPEIIEQFIRLTRAQQQLRPKGS